MGAGRKGAGRRGRKGLPGNGKGQRGSNHWRLTMYQRFRCRFGLHFRVTGVNGWIIYGVIGQLAITLLQEVKLPAGWLARALGHHEFRMKRSSTTNASMETPISGFYGQVKRVCPAPVRRSLLMELSIAKTPAGHGVSKAQQLPDVNRPTAMNLRLSW